MKKRIESLLKKSGFDQTPSGGWEKRNGKKDRAVFYFHAGSKENFTAYFTPHKQTTIWTIEARPASNFVERFARLAIESLCDSL